MNCKIGDLAIVVSAALPENIGKVVFIEAAAGYSIWDGFDEFVFLWRVRALGPECPLLYEYWSGRREMTLVGHVPDCYLQPIRSKGLSVSSINTIEAEINA